MSSGASVRETISLHEGTSYMLTRLQTLQTEEVSQYTPMSVLDKMIAAGWGDVPQNRIPDTWREVAPPEAGSRKKTLALAAMKLCCRCKKEPRLEGKGQSYCRACRRAVYREWQLHKKNDSSLAQFRKEKKEKREEDLKNRMLAHRRRFNQDLRKRIRSGHPIWTVETIIDGIERFIIRHGRTPTQSDFCTDKGLPSTTQVHRLFGRPQAAVCAAKARLNGRGVSYIDSTESRKHRRRFDAPVGGRGGGVLRNEA